MINPNTLNIQNHKYMKTAVNIMGAICILIGLFTIVMWKIHRVDLLVYMGSTMFFNTALCFVVSGTALLFLETRFSSVGRILGIIVVLFSIAVISQDVFHINLGIDELFEDFYYPLPGTIPGRMAIQTSVNFILSGLAVSILADKKLTRLKILFGLILGSIVFIISIIAVFGYFAHLAQSYGWQLINPISINTAITFLFLGLGLILYAIWKSIHMRIPIVDYGHYIIFISVIFGAFLLYQALLSQARTTIESMTNNYGQDLLHSFERTLESSVNRFDPVVFRLSGQAIQVNHQSWEQYSNYLFKNEKFVEYVGFFSEKFEPIMVHTKMDIHLTSESLKKTFSKDQEISMSAPFSFGNNQHGYFVVYPIISPQLKGYLVRVININALIQATGAELYKDEMFLNITQNGKLFYNSPGAQAYGQKYVKEFHSEVYGKEWDLKVWPTPLFIEKNRTPLPEITLGFGVLFAFFLSFSFRSNLIAYNRAQELQKIQVNLLMAQEIASLGGWCWDLREDKINFSSQALKLLGLDVNQKILSADQFFYLIHPNETETLKNAIATMKSGRSGYSEIYTFIRPDKETRQIRFAAEVSAFFNHFPIEISGILQDVTKLKVLEEELHQSQKLELIGQLTGGIAHDFNNILMVIQGNLELLSFMMDKGSNEYKKVETALTACTRGSALTKRLLAFARQKTFNPEVLDIKSYMEGFSHILQSTLGESVESSVEIAPILGKIKVDPNQLESALLNLIINARDAMGQGGRLKIKVDNISSEQTESMKKGKVPFGSYVRISIADSGSGISPEVMKHIFEPFFTTKPPNKGTGLGLSMVKSFVEQSQGYITLSSHIGVGTTIDLYFPIFTHGEDQRLDAQLVTRKDFLKGKETILVTEDEEEVRVTAVEFLKNLGYTVLEAQNGDEAYEILRKNKRIDLLFTDMVMPGSLSGATLAEKVIKLHPQLKILYTSGYPEKIKGNGHALSPLIIKPYKLMDLAVTIKNLFVASTSDK